VAVVCCGTAAVDVAMLYSRSSRAPGGRGGRWHVRTCTHTGRRGSVQRQHVRTRRQLVWYGTGAAASSPAR